MKSETRNFQLKVLSPLHLGCDEVYEPTSFVVKEKEKTLVSFNPLHFPALLEKEKREQYLAICRKGTAESLLEIYKFINREAQEISGVTIKIDDEFLHHYQSVLRLSPQAVSRNLNQFTINRTAFNSLDGDLYIPGSAVKGSMRTAVLNLRYRTSGRGLQRRRNKDLQLDLLGGGFESDPFSRVKISDFCLAGEVARCICYAVDEKKKPGDKKSSAVYQILEIIEPGAVFEGTITIVGSEQKDISQPVSFMEIEQALSGFFGRERIREETESKVIGAACSRSPEQGDLPIRLGRHSGAESVTSVDGDREIKILTGKGNPPKTLNHATTIWFASPNKNPNNKALLRPFGWASLHEATAEELAIGNEFRKRRKESRDAGLEELRQRRAEEQHKRNEERKNQEAVKAEKQRLAEEAARYPWKPWMGKLSQIEEWGDFQREILTNEQAAEWRLQDGVAQAVKEAAERVQRLRLKKWDNERDTLVTEWLAATDVAWQPLVTSEDQEVEVSPLVQQIRNYGELGAYQSQPVEMAELDMDAALELKIKFKEWGCDSNKAKKNKVKLWKDLNKHINEMKKR